MERDEGVYGWRVEDGKMRVCMGGEGRICEGR